MVMRHRDPCTCQSFPRLRTFFVTRSLQSMRTTPPLNCFVRRRDSKSIKQVQADICRGRKQADADFRPAFRMVVIWAGSWGSAGTAHVTSSIQAKSVESKAGQVASSKHQGRSPFAPNIWLWHCFLRECKEKTSGPRCSPTECC